MRRALPIIVIVLMLAAACSGGTPPRTAKIELKEKDDVYLQFIRADLHAISGETRKSTAELLRLVQRYPEMAYFHYLLAQNYGQEKRFDQAIDEAKQALDLEPGFSEARIFLGRVYAAQDRHADAAHEYAIVVRDDPRREEVYPLLANEQVAQREYAAALATLKRLVAINPDAVAGYFYMGLVNDQHLKRPAEALRLYQEALAIDPASVSVHNAIAELYLRQKQMKKALAKYEEISHLEPDDVAVQLRIALIHYELKEYDAAIIVFERILATNPEADKIRFYLGVLYESAKKNDEAVAQLSQVPSKSSYFKDARIHTASLLRQAGKVDDAIDVLRDAVAKKGQIPEFYEYLAAIFEESRRYAEAIAILEEGHKALPDEEKISFLLGIVYEKAEDRVRAVGAMEDVLRVNPQNASALNYIGYTWAERGENLDQALQYVQQALVLRPGDGYITDSLGWVHFRMGDSERALKYLQQANKIVPGEPTILDHLGDILLERGDAKGALRIYEQALDAGSRKKEPDPKELERIREKIGKLKAQ